MFVLRAGQGQLDKPRPRWSRWASQRPLSCAKAWPFRETGGMFSSTEGAVVVEIRAGETWIVYVALECRTVKVIDPGDSPGWWNCLDLASGLDFVAREQWFLKRKEVRGGRCEASSF